MTVMTRIRQNMGIVVVLVALSLVAFILTDFFTSATRIFGGPPDAGEVAGQTITYQEFAARYNNRLELARQQVQAAGATLSDNDRFFIMNDEWNNIVKEIVYKDEFDDIGLEVTGEEIFDMFAGKNIADEVRQSFQGQFDQLGRPFNPDDMVRMLEQYVADPQASQSLKQFEDYLAKARSEKKYKNMVKNGYVGSRQFANQKYLDQSKKVDLAFVGINYAQISDSLVDVSDSKLRSYLTKNSEKYKQTDATYFDYISLDVSPSGSDSSKSRTSLLKMRKPFSDSKSDSLYAASKSRVPFRGDSLNISQFPVDVRDSLRSGSEGQVFGPFLEANYYKLYKLVAKASGDETFVKIDHILVTPDGVTKEDSTNARSEAARLRSQASGSNFAELVAEHSDDFQTKDLGGTLGWYAKGSYGEDFDKSVEKASVGSIIGPIKSSRGYHVVRILDKTKDVYAVAEVEKEVFAGEETVKSVYREANKYLATARAGGDLNAVATENNLVARNSGPIANDATFVPGLNVPSRNMILWAINDANVGDFSDVFSVGEKYVFAQVTEKRKAGVQDLETVRPQIFREVANMEKAKIIKEKLGDTSGKDINAIQSAYGDQAFVSNATDISFESASVPGIGNDPYIVGRAVGMQKGEISGPIQGKNGVFIIQVTEVKEPPPADDNTLAGYRNNAALTGQNKLETNLDNALIEIADVKDTRYKANF